MNILVPDSWLREYLETAVTPQELARLGSLHGPSFERIEQVEGESVYDVEITTNRVDLMSMKGLAREMVAILGEKAQGKNLAVVDKIDLKVEVKELPLPQIVVKTDEVKKIVTVVLDEVKNVESPAWLQKRLRQIGQTPHGVIVDVTNYVTQALGHPCHAFDYDKVMGLGGKIIVKRADVGKKFVTLDGIEYQTRGGEVVFENEAGEIIDLPAIKGTANTAIEEKTTRVLFWLENLEAKVVREASMGHAIRTVAAILNEKNVDESLMEETLTLGVQLLRELAGAKVASEVYRLVTVKTQKKQVVRLNLERVNAYLGVELKMEEVIAILKRLELLVEKKQGGQLWVVVPSFRRHDIMIEEDLIEEVARIYGYYRLASKTDFKQVQIAAQEGVYFDLESRLKHYLAAVGLMEVYTYSMVSKEMIEASREKEYLRLTNPLSEDHVYLRESLIPSLLQVAADNHRWREMTRGIFEIAKVYVAGEKQTEVTEVVKLALLTPLPYREARAVIEGGLAIFYLTMEVSGEGEIVVIGREGKKRTVGKVKEVAGELLAWELEVAALGELAREYPKVKELNDQPTLVEDLTFVVKQKKVGDLLKRMKQVSPLLQKVMLVDIYECNYTFRYWYQGKERALTSKEVAPIREAVVGLMRDEGCALVGELLI
jgi:phenylalanyl-tRNA synthetase beta chain